MQFDSPSTPAPWIVATAMLLAGCNTLDKVSAPLRNAFTPATTASGSGGSAEKSANASVVAIKPPQADVPPVATATQRAFDEAVRAMRAGRTDDAERGFKALAAAHPELGGPHANLGLLYRQAGKWDEAVAALEKAVKANAQQPIYANQLGIAYRQQGQFAKARDAYERAIALDANYAAAHLNLGILHDLYLVDRAKALPEYERYLTLTPSGDATVAKWVTDLRNRKPATAGTSAAVAVPAAPKEKP